MGLDYIAACITEECEKSSGHKTGLCTECRQKKCAFCHGPLIKQSLEAKNNKCGKCKISDQNAKRARLRD